MPSLLIHNIGLLATPETQGTKRLSGNAMSNIRTFSNAAIVVENGIITRIGESTDLFANVPPSTQILDAQGMTAVPGFVDSHTHTVFGGNRANEFAMRSAGKTYQEIAAAGGGIISTMTATRNASHEQLYAVAKKRLDAMLLHGTTTVEIKSGYGLDTASELKMLEVIQELQKTHPMTIVPTFLGAHAFPPEYKENRAKYVDIVCEEMLPAVKERSLAVFCDIFCEQNYFSLQDAERILQAAQNLGFPIKIHADQLSASGASQLGVRLGAVSVDHLECTTLEGASIIAASETIATALPGASLFLNHPYPPMRALIDAGGAVALATDFNPGSSMTFSMPMMMTLVATQMRMTPEEALTAATLNGAAALMLSHERGSLEVGKKADILLADVEHFYELSYHFGMNHIRHVVKNGKVIV
jgi:imidazolonepropionase